MGIFEPMQNVSTIKINATFVTPVDPPADPVYEVIGDLRDFTIHLLGANTSLEFINVKFNKITFTAETGKKPSVDPDIAEVKFVGVPRLRQHAPGIPAIQ